MYYGVICMKMILLLFLVISASSANLGCELKDDKETDCRKLYERGITGLVLACSSIEYLAENEYADFDDCMLLSSQLIWISANDCEARKQR